MRDYWGAVLDAVVDLQPDDLISAILLGLLQALALAGAYVYWRRKVSDVLPLLVGLMLLVSISSMALALGHARYRATTGPTGTESLALPGPMPGSTGPSGPEQRKGPTRGFVPPPHVTIPPPWLWGFGPPPWAGGFYPTPLRRSAGLPPWGWEPPRRDRPAWRPSPAGAAGDDSATG
ncbi:MAG: hypothetical protein U0790_26040 [Isosphaeraceae bacterium]